jgi:hypothetical protein
MTPGATAQDTVDIGFKSVGRGQPLSTGVHDVKEVSPAWMGGFFPGERHLAEVFRARHDGAGTGQRATLGRLFRI